MVLLLLLLILGSVEVLIFCKKVEYVRSESIGKKFFGYNFKNADDFDGYRDERGY
jgi:hypothetical protein